MIVVHGEYAHIWGWCGSIIAAVSEPLSREVLESAVAPREVAQQSFKRERRGFKRAHVQQYLHAVAASLADAQQREADMRSRLGKAIRRAEAAEQELRDHQRDVDRPSAANQQVGDDVTEILEAARATAAQRTAAAEKSASDLLRKATAEASDMRAAADAVLTERTREAELVAAEIVADARRVAEEEAAQAAIEADAVRLKAIDRIAQVTNECNGLIREAEEARGQILEDMERRRRDARAQVERLRVGRDRLLRSYEVVRRTLEETTGELKVGLKEAKVRGDSAGRDITSRPLATREQLEIELADAKLIGRITTSSPTPEITKPPLRSKALPRPLDPPQVPNIDLRGESAPTSKSAANNKPAVKKPMTVRAPAVAPILSPSRIADSSETAEALEDDNLDVVEPADDIEAVTPMPCERTTADDGLTLFELLVQPSRDSTFNDAPEREELTEEDFVIAMEQQRQVVIADAAIHLERCLKLALADEQDELLAGLRHTKKKHKLKLIEVMGDLDDHLQRYVVAINEVAAKTYAAGADLVEAEPVIGGLPAGAVEEMLLAQLVDPIRDQLATLDELDVASVEEHVGPVRSLYREQRSDQLAPIATRLATLLCIAGVCDGLPENAPLPWVSLAK